MLRSLTIAAFITACTIEKPMEITLEVPPDATRDSLFAAMATTLTEIRDTDHSMAMPDLNHRWARTSDRIDRDTGDIIRSIVEAFEFHMDTSPEEGIYHGSYRYTVDITKDDDNFYNLPEGQKNYNDERGDAHLYRVGDWWYLDTRSSASSSKYWDRQEGEWYPTGDARDRTFTAVTVHFNSFILLSGSKFFLDR